MTLHSMHVNSSSQKSATGTAKRSLKELALSAAASKTSIIDKSASGSFKQPVANTSAALKKMPSPAKPAASGSLPSPKKISVDFVRARVDKLVKKKGVKDFELMEGGQVQAYVPLKEKKEVRGTIPKPGIELRQATIRSSVRLACDGDFKARTFKLGDAVLWHWTGTTHGAVARGGIIKRLGVGKKYNNIRSTATVAYSDRSKVG
ncbi:hypothetical protein V8E36_004029 [Tilletia maclaganii]